VPLAEVYLEFLGGRCRPNTVLAAASDLRVFFAVVAKPPGQVRAADVLAFVTAQRTGHAGGHGVLQPLDLGAEAGGVSAATVRRRLSIVSGFFAFLQARGDVAANLSRSKIGFGWVTCRSSVRQAACVYSLIRPLRIGFRRICCVPTSVTAARGATRSSSGARAGRCPGAAGAVL
jgi:Phage integrase, N-terminal SAM-like domain